MPRVYAGLLEVRYTNWSGLARKPIGSLKRSCRRAADGARYLSDYRRFRRLHEESGRGLAMRWADRHAVCGEWTATTGFDTHYTYHPAWAARILMERRPAEHVDISSSLAFIAVASAWVPIRFYDYRPANLRLSNLQCDRADLTKLHFADRSIPSLSCMHVVEHIGLGRYGDPLSPLGDLTAMRELQRVLAPGGDLLFVVPVGRPRICYNAHRVYSVEMIQEAFAELTLKEFSLITESPEGGLTRHADPAMAAKERYGCGCFWFQRAP